MDKKVQAGTILKQLFATTSRRCRCGCFFAESLSADLQHPVPMKDKMQQYRDCHQIGAITMQRFVKPDPFAGNQSEIKNIAAENADQTGKEQHDINPVVFLHFCHGETS